MVFVSAAVGCGSTDEQLIERQTSKLPDVDRLVVYAIDEIVSGDGEFPIRAYERQHAPVLSSTVIRRGEARRMAELWRHLSFEKGWQALCHEPPYGVRFYRGDELVFETSICWSCTNFFVRQRDGSYDWYGFHAEDLNAETLFAELQKLVPHPKIDVDGNPREVTVPLKR